MGRILIREAVCKGCMLCARVCPRENIVPARTFNGLGYRPAAQKPDADCLGCAACALVCPDAAIRVWRTKAAAVLESVESANCPSEESTRP